MGNVVPDRFFWALPPGEQAAEGEATELTDDLPPPHARNVH
jgi:hydroxymethylpyrimidine/phosphomethylpyrimidine kinase